MAVVQGRPQPVPKRTAVTTSGSWPAILQDLPSSSER
jgi:hypothetical protein